METKEQLERRLREDITLVRNMGPNKYFHTLMDDVHTIYDKPTASQHPHWDKIMMLYKLINKRTHGHAKKMIGRIIDRVQRYGGDYKLKKRDYVLMNEYYRVYKK